jgi:uncharacterized protein YbjT (DUF2867 family)
MTSQGIERPGRDPGRLILVTGATGYVGGRLLRALRARNERVRCTARHPEHLRSRVDPGVEIVRCDVLDPSTLGPALQGAHTAYYLVHSMGSAGSFEDQDRIAARAFGDAAREAGLRRIVYLGGLGETGDRLSPHLRSRHEVGDILRGSGVPVVEFRASIIIGSGSLSFEMIRALVERLPIMITPRWVAVLAQPIAIADVLEYLLGALDLETTEGEPHAIFEIGGADRVSYGEIMHEYARQRGLRRVMIPVPVLTPRLSSLWLGLVTPLYARVGRKLIDSMRHTTVVRDDSARERFAVRPKGIRDTVRDALRGEDQEFGATRWSDALSAGGTPRNRGGVRFGSRLVDSRAITIGVPAPVAFAAIERIGGKTGWYYADWLWAVRGFIDLLVGGVGIRRGRGDSEHVRVGDTVDWWRVEAIEPGCRLRLAAEMKLPGRAWLEFEVEPAGETCRLRQTAIFDPAGLSGLVYWYGIYPLHRLVFAGMLRGLGAAATRSGRVSQERPAA